MPWNDNNDGGRQGPGSANGSNSNGSGGPWGQGPSRPRGPQRPGGGNQPPDLEEILKRGQDRLKNVLPRGGSGGGGGGGSPQLPKATPAVIGIAAAALIGLYLFSSYYQVAPDEQGVELVFGSPKTEISEPGPHFAFWPIETVEKAQTVERQIQVGSTRSANRQSLMLSGDQNIVDVTFGVLYNVSDIKKFLFEVREPEAILAEVAESAMREVVGRRPAQDIFRDDKAGISNEVLGIVRATLDEYNTGIEVRAITIENAAPPEEVADAFEEVQRAEQDEDRLQEEANRERNRILGGARGEAASIREEAAAYKNRIVQEAEGEAARFLSVYEQYARAPEVTRKRLFLETMEEVLADSNKVIVESGQGGQGVVPYLPLPELQNRQRGNAQSTQNAGN